jgi:flagellar assembly protein FliH
MSDDFSQTSQNDFQETPYQQACWEVVGEASAELAFTPLDVKVVGRLSQAVDPMFADYGGLPDDGSRFYRHEKDPASPDFVEDKDEEVEQLRRVSEEELELKLNEAREEVEAKVRQELGEQHAVQLKELSERYETLIQDFSIQFQERERACAVSATELAVEIAKKLIEEAVEINPEYILPIIQEALGLAGTANVIQVRVSPQDMEFLEIMNVRKTVEGAQGNWQFIADESIRLGCIVDTSAGEIDFQLDKAWERTKAAIVKVIK